MTRCRQRHQSPRGPDLRGLDVSCCGPSTRDVTTPKPAPASNPMQLETKFLRLRTPVTLESRFGEWHVTWLGGWSRYRLYYLVVVVKLQPLRARSDACSRPSERSYSEHDAQKCRTAGADRNGSRNGASGLGFDCERVERGAGTGSSRDPVLIDHPCVWRSQRGRVLLRFSQSAVVIQGVDTPIFSAYPGIHANLGLWL